MEVATANGGGKNRVRKSNSRTLKDPELEAEIMYAKENGYDAPKVIPSAEKKLADLAEDIDGMVFDKHLLKTLKNGRAERKARSRGVSGCSIKKDGNRFEYGLDCIDLQNDVVVSDYDSTDEEFNEYADYVVKYSENEIREIVSEFLLNGKLEDSLMESMRKFCFNIDTSSRLMKDLILLSVEHGHDGGIELGVKLLSEIIRQEFVSVDLLTDVFEELVNSLVDLMKDSPKINDSLAIFMAKLVDHEVWDNHIIKLLAGKSVGQGSLIEKCYEDALAFVKNHLLLQLECPPVGPCETTDTLSSQFSVVLGGYIESGDKEATGQRLLDLKVPHFNHEFVYQTGVMAMEKMNENKMQTLAELLNYMIKQDIITEPCVSKGFERLFEGLPELYLDLPAVYNLVSRWVDKSLKLGFISQEIADKCPKPPRTRTRTLSEGPDGKLSCTDSETEDSSESNNEWMSCNEDSSDK